MELPDVTTTVRDQARNVTYVVCAYRALSDTEAKLAVRYYLGTSKRPKSGSTVRIITTLGRE